MTPKRIYILNGHPAETSLSKTFAAAYAGAAQAAGHEIRVTNLHDLNFDSDFGYGGFSKIKPLESSLEKVIEDIEWSEHVVLALPMWWGGLPAKLKGLFDRALLPGRAFDTRVKKGKMPKPMLSGRSARVIITSDTPGWLMRFIYKNALLRQLNGQILGFIGIKPSRVTYFAGASEPEPGVVDRWIEKVRAIGMKAA